MLSLALFLIVWELLCHAALALLHLRHLLEWLLERLSLPSPSNEARESLIGLLYAALTAGLVVAGSAYWLSEHRSAVIAVSPSETGFAYAHH